MSYLSELSDDDRMQLAVRLAAHMLLPRDSEASTRRVAKVELENFADRLDKALLTIEVEDTLKEMIDTGVFERIPGEPGYLQRGPNWETFAQQCEAEKAA